jgi:hypothetical protein
MSDERRDCHQVECAAAATFRHRQAELRQRSVDEEDDEPPATAKATTEGFLSAPRQATSRSREPGRPTEFFTAVTRNLVSGGVPDQLVGSAASDDIGQGRDLVRRQFDSHRGDVVLEV